MRKKPTNKLEYAGTTFASAYERGLAEFFDQHGIAWEYEPERIPWVPAVRYYKPDFRITLPDGRVILLEAKGFFDQSSRSKMAQVKKQHPDTDIWFVFMKGANKLSKKTGSLTYTEWATKNGFPVLELPKLAQEIQKTNDTNRRKPKGKSCRPVPSSSENRTCESTPQVPCAPITGAQSSSSARGIPRARTRGLPSARSQKL